MPGSLRAACVTGRATSKSVPSPRLPVIRSEPPMPAKPLVQPEQSEGARLAAVSCSHANPVVTHLELHGARICGKPNVDVPRTSMSCDVAQGFLQRGMQHGLLHAAQRRQAARDLQVCRRTCRVREFANASFDRRNQAEVLGSGRLG